MATVNFLPWRQQRRRRFWRFWCLLVTGSVLVAGLMTQSLSVSLEQDRQVQRVYLQADTTLYRLLVQRQQDLHGRRQQIIAQRARQQQYARTGRWQQTLLQVAARLPAQVWLTQLEFRQGALKLSGYSLSLRALTGLDAALEDMPGFVNGKAGRTRRDESGRWQFHYQLTQEPHDAAGS